MVYCRQFSIIFELLAKQEYTFLILKKWERFKMQLIYFVPLFMFL